MVGRDSDVSIAKGRKGVLVGEESCEGTDMVGRDSDAFCFAVLYLAIPIVCICEVCSALDSTINRNGPLQATLRTRRGSFRSDTPAGKTRMIDPSVSSIDFDSKQKKRSAVRYIIVIELVLPVRCFR